MHDPSIDRSENGGQYRSAIFYTDETQKKVAEKLVATLNAKGINVSTELSSAGPFWRAETRHQKYCDSRGMSPRDHYTKRF